MTRCVLCAAPIDWEGAERPVCRRCGEGLGAGGGAEAMREKLNQLVDFGLGSEARPLFSPPSEGTS